VGQGGTRVRVLVDGRPPLRAHRLLRRARNDEHAAFDIGEGLACGCQRYPPGIVARHIILFLGSRIT
jgi:hypothetical protein